MTAAQRSLGSIVPVDGPSMSMAAPTIGEAHVLRILVAEDDPGMRKLIVSTLEQDGYEILEARDGVEMMVHVGSSVMLGELGTQREMPNLIVSDFRMPGVNGLELLRGLRASGRLVPFVLITAFGDSETHDEAHRMGAAAVIDKPFDLEELRALVFRTLHP